MSGNNTFGNINIGGSILLVTPSMRMDRLLSGLFESEGYSVKCCQGIDEGSREISTMDPDIVLLDTDALNHDLENTIQAINRHSNSHIPIVLIESPESQTDRSAAFRTGISDILYEDAVPEEILSKVALLIRSRQIALALESTARQLVQSSLMRDRLSRMIVHDLRSPLSSLVLILETVDNPEEMLDLPRQSIELARAQVRLVEEFCDQLMIAGRLETRQLSPNPVEGSLRQAVENAISSYSLQAQSQEVEFLVDAEDVMVTVDHGLLSRMVLNLFSNAVKATAKGGTVRVSAGIDKDKITVEVADEGPGIPPKLESTLFELTNGAGETTTSVTQGLGLAFCRIAATAMGGHVELTSTSASGSVFRLVLPFTEQTLDAVQ